METKELWNTLSNGEKAWYLGLIMMYMNNEEAYYESGWLYIWPDGEKYEDCMSDFANDASYKELEDSFKRHYKEYHKDGLFSNKPLPGMVTLFAHYWDEQLGLKPIEILKPTW